MTLEMRKLITGLGRSSQSSETKCTWSTTLFSVSVLLSVQSVNRMFPHFVSLQEESIGLRKNANVRNDRTMFDWQCRLAWLPRLQSAASRMFADQTVTVCPVTVLPHTDPLSTALSTLTSPGKRKMTAHSTTEQAAVIAN